MKKHELYSRPLTRLNMVGEVKRIVEHNNHSVLWIPIRKGINNCII